MQKSLVVCLRHPKYDGKANPELRCKACCSIFVNRIKDQNEKRAMDVETWLESKAAPKKSSANGG